MLLCCWKQFYASLNGSVQKEMLLCCWKRFYASLDGSVRQEMLLCCLKRFYVSLDESVRQEMLLWDKLLAGTAFWKFPPKFEEERAEPSFYVVMTHHTAKANLEKGSSWPPEAIPYGLSYTMSLVLTQPICPTPWTRPQMPPGPRTSLRFSY